MFYSVDQIHAFGENVVGHTEFIKACVEHFMVELGLEFFSALAAMKAIENTVHRESVERKMLLVQLAFR